MAEFKMVISNPQNGKSVQREAKDQAAQRLIGMKIGDKVKGEILELAGYELEVTGGSDYCGFPMRRDLPGVGRKRILAVEGVGLATKGKGIRQRKTVCGNTIHARIAQINMKVLKEGGEKIFGENVKKGASAEKKEEKKAEVKEEPAKKEKTAEAKEVLPKEEKKAPAEKK